MSSRPPLAVLLLTLAALLVPHAATAADHPPLGAYAQLTGAAGCIGGDGAADGCRPATGFGDALETHASADGRHLYALTYTPGTTLVALAIDPLDGSLHELPGGCRAAAPREGCELTPELWRPATTALAPDGRHLYVAGESGAGAPMRLWSFVRDPASGLLTRVPGADGCVTAGPAEADCRAVTGLGNANALAFSPDGSSLYLASASLGSSAGGLATFARDAASGRLTQPSATGCLSDAPAPPAGCVAARALAGGAEVAVSADGRNVYVGGGTDAAATIAVFTRGAQGGLTQPAGTAGCVRGGGAAGDCAAARGMNAPIAGAFPSPLALAPDGATLYKGASSAAGGIAVFARDAGSGALSQLPGRDGCVANGAATADCAGGLGVGGLWGIEAAPGGEAVLAFAYDGGIGARGDVAVFERRGTGALTQRAAPFGCLSSWPDPACLETRALTRTNNGTIAPDGGTVYVNGWDSNAGDPSALVVLSREAAPICEDGSAEALAGGADAIVTLACREPNGQALTRTIVRWPAHGTLRALEDGSGRFAYRADGDYAGADEIVFRAGDGAYESAPARIALTVTRPVKGGPPPVDGPPQGPGPRPRDPGPPACGNCGAPQQRLALVGLRGPLTPDARGRVRLRLRCVQGRVSTCATTLTLRTTKRPLKMLGSARVSIARGRTATVTVTLSKAAQRQLRRARSVNVTVTAGDLRRRVTVKVRGGRR
ncbi:hypothetical protein VSS74_24860 [Conexibacter stalactiti]|uniref:Lactonase family protein n=1 Tax=Conexibacter stalactiti TaxID=1940611 RepID=A0ABU4HYQ2_9ACTN|nr:hypothetical protein [Conexibacter stalactiti]MDW5597605.1 hypothetical protein [Conexibacter stalactiti]MEC5038247.1 hypothetical protein [Conexibacter stalactiti]